MKRDAAPETCHPYEVQKEGGAASHVLQTGIDQNRDHEPAFQCG